jgi:cell division protein FtsQ
MKSILKISALIPFLYLLMMPVYLSSSTNSVPCSGIRIDIRDSSNYHFVTRKQLLNLAYGNQAHVLGRPVSEISLIDIENRLKTLRELKDAEVYRTIDGEIHVFADQREPVMRVIPAGGGDYFIDEDGIVVRKRNLYTPRLHIVGGNVNINQAMLNGTSILDTTIKNSILKDLYELVRYINDDDFWSAWIDQINVDNEDEIDLIPRASNHVIHLGTIVNYKGKLRNLEAFYDKVLPVVGWNKYSVIDLEFRDQIVCRKR